MAVDNMIRIDFVVQGGGGFLDGRHGCGDDGEYVWEGMKHQERGVGERGCGELLLILRGGNCRI
jgi:hypothetical protein